MRIHIKQFVIFAVLVIGISLVFAGIVSATPPQQTDAEQAKIDHGAYLVHIIGCDACHTPPLAEYADPANLTLEQIQTLAFNDKDSWDMDKYMAGGRVFDLGPMGTVVTRNLTPDEETGLGAWTDQEIKDAITLGVSRDGHQLLPVMPYLNFNQMADDDVDAIIAFLRTLQPVKNDAGPYLQAMPPMNLQPSGPAEAPSPDDELARGEYLVKAALSCTDCHTPLDPETFEPDLSMYLAGGQPFEGPWGIVYGGNITPDKNTGIGKYTEAELALVLSSGILPTGRRAILMPWYTYTNMTPEDLRAVVTYLLEGLDPVENEVPAPAVEAPFELYADQSQ